MFGIMVCYHCSHPVIIQPAFRHSWYIVLCSLPCMTVILNARIHPGETNNKPFTHHTSQPLPYHLSSSHLQNNYPEKTHHATHPHSSNCPPPHHHNKTKRNTRSFPRTQPPPSLQSPATALNADVAVPGDALLTQLVVAEGACDVAEAEAGADDGQASGG